MKSKSPSPAASATENPFQAKWAVLTGAHRLALRAASKRSRRNVFADRRIAENDPTLPEDDRYLARLQRERSRRTKKRARYTLADDDDDRTPLHLRNDQPSEPARSFSLLRDDYDDAEGVALEDGADEQQGSDDEFLTLKGRTTEHAEEVDDHTPKTHQEIMDEVVLKSKMYKAKRQQDKHMADEQTAKLDQELPDIMALLNKSSSDFAREKADAKNASLEKPPASIFGDDEKDSRPPQSAKPPPSQATREGGFSYEHVYRQLAEEKRARPSDRLLTEEERAEKELEELQELERMRSERMRSAGDSDDENDDTEPSRSRRPRAKREKTTTKKEKHPGGDDLDDGFDLSEEDEEDSGSEDEDEDEDVAKQPNKVSEGAEAGDSSSDEEEEELDPDSMVFSGTYESKESDQDIPYVFKECPSSPAGLQKLFEERTIAGRQLVIERLRKCFAVSLNPTPYAVKLDRLLECILMRIERLTKVSSQHLQSALAEIDMLLGHAHALGKKNETLVAGWAKDHLASAFHALTSPKTSAGLSERWGVPVLLVLRTIGRLFPSTDLRHPVSTPLVLLLSDALSLSRMVRSVDLAMGSFIAGLLIEQMAGAGRYSGQLAMFVTSVLRAAYCSGEPKLADSLKEFREEGTKAKTRKLKLADLMREGERDQREEYALQAMVVECAVCLAEALGMSGRIGHLDIIFERVPLGQLPQTASCTLLYEAMSKSQANRKPLALYTVSAAATVRKALNPKFSAESGVFRRAARTSYHGARSGDMSKSAMRVRRALRKEERGLARDIRQGAAAKRVEREKDLEERRERGEKRAREAMAFLESQQANWKKAEKRQKMLAGKKW